MKKQLLLMITAISISLTISAQGIVEPGIYEQIFEVGNPTGEGQILLTDYGSTGVTATGKGYEQFTGDGEITFSLQSTADLNNVSLVFQYRHWTGNVGDIAITIDTDIININGIDASSPYFTELNGAGSVEFYLIPLSGTYSFTSGVTKNFKFTMTNGNIGTGSALRRRYYNVRVINNDVLSTNDFIAKNDIKVFPNPVKDHFELSSKIDVNNIQVFSLTGRLVKVLESATNNYDISDLKSGLYLATINTDSGSGTVKLIKR